MRDGLQRTTAERNTAGAIASSATTQEVYELLTAHPKSRNGRSKDAAGVEADNTRTAPMRILFAT